ncbi:bifunctional DNA-binding transcriptional regulator/O6-methylguanine-DNA methyltransferase Ada [Pseudomonas turukhanskensis]|uniref:methylated-DNA--[protein]-cysteine S-methyltransferase n=1 Tax=Pseudomonas turukhanskensis TaxID=1806536 RepID=A0A9W6KCU9_9PSED|nr:bifunctional DNA-binding transcriptional regulator/O6-methylguanine-DNA methyltransferase Ada [Pseudomonas turukhanskensis]GLK91895.1 bifunctional transcriptional activator/DNA repair enzyme protein Ada [Pseudomonas turukhanskensis]
MISLPGKQARAAQTLNDPRWPLVQARDKTADGQFVYSVKTTGVYCRPSCSARQALPENVQFHSTCQAAEQAGFRPCLRCKPDQQSLAQQQRVLVEQACRLIAAAQTPPSLDELAAQIGLSPYHFHRLFKSITGVTPKGYANAQRAARVRNHLQQGETVTDALYDAGFNSSGRFYTVADTLLGMTPKTYKDGGTNVQIRYAIGRCSLGDLLVAQSDRGICAILFGESVEALNDDLQRRFPRATLVPGDAAFTQTLDEVIAFVEAPAKGLDLPLDIRGTVFQQRVWQALQAITPGKTASYREVAERIGMPSAVRAVAGACAANALAVAVPCHRVVRSDGALSGYRWGVERKRVLLEKEAE